MTRYLEPWERQDPNDAYKGTVTRKRPNPRENVQDVGIAEARGMTIGPDGYPHPLESNGNGALHVTDRTLRNVLEDMLDVLTDIRDGMVAMGLIEGSDDSIG